MRLLIRRLADDGITVLLSSHQLPEVQELCDRVAIVDTGRVVYEGALADLRRQGGAGYRLRTTDDARALAVARAQAGIERRGARRAGIGFQAEERARRRAVAGARRARASAILALTPELATLEDLFFRLTEDDDREAARRDGAAARPSGQLAAQRMSAASVAPRRGARAGALERAVDAHGLPLGAAQARLAEAHLPRPRPGDRAAADLRGRPEPAPATTTTRRQHLRVADHASRGWRRRC